MSPEATFVCYLVAFVAFVIAAVFPAIVARINQLSWVAIGLAAFVLPALWHAAEVAF